MYKTQLSIHTPKHIIEIQIIPFTIASKKYLEINLSWVLKDLCMKTSKTIMKEIFKDTRETYFVFIDWKN